MASSTPVQQGQKRPLSPEPSPSKDENQPSSKRATLKLNTIPPSEQQCLVPQAQQPTTSMEQRAFLTVPAINWVGLIASTDDTEQASTSSAQPSQTGEITNKNQGKRSELEDFLNRDLSFLQQTIFLFTKDENGKLRSNKSLLFLLAHLENTELTDLANAVKCDGHYCLLKTSINMQAFTTLRTAYNRDNSFVNLVLNAKKIVGLSWHLQDHLKVKLPTMVQQRKHLKRILAENNFLVSDALLEHLYTEIRDSKLKLQKN